MNKKAKAVSIEHQRFWLLPEKAIYWPKKKILMLADLHIGKAGHFRKHGIPVPGRLNRSNLNSLTALIEDLNPSQLVILGDLFHSRINKEWNDFIEWRKKYPSMEVNLVIGNHDVLAKPEYHSGYINLFKRLNLGPFLIVHNISDISNHDDRYVLGGHIHPAVKLKGNGKQSIKLPCFYFGSRYGVLPAFGRFTGTHVIKPKEKDRIYLILDSEVIAA